LRACRFSAQAEADLMAISRYIAADNPRRALTFIAELRQRCADLVDFPQSAPLREEFGEGIRLASHGNYLIFYSVDEAAVVVEHIRHRARSLEGLRL